MSAGTARSWLSLLEDAFLIRLLAPHFTNRTRRMIKSPRLYFLDAGLAAWLGGWRTADEVRLGPMGGALFETHVLAEVSRRFRHCAREADVHFWRTRDGQDIDFLIESDGRTWPVEVKMGSPRHDRLPSLRRIAEPSWQAGQVVSLAAPAAPVRVTDDWIRCAPRDLDLGAAAGAGS